MTQPQPRIVHLYNMKTKQNIAKRLIIVSVLSFTLLTSCHKDKLEANDLIGKWNWLSSSGGIAGTTYTPESTGDVVVIEFTPDSVFRRYLNDSLIIESTFSIRSSESIYDHNPTQILVFDPDYVRQSFQFESPDELVLLDEVYDGFVSRYRRMD